MTYRVGINLAWLVPGVVGGSEEATVGAVRAVGATASSGVELVLFVLPALAATYPDLSECFEVHTLDHAGSGKAHRVLAETTELPRLVSGARLSLMHHGGGVVPLRSRGLTTLAVHDTQPLDLPGNFSVVKRRYLAAMIPRSVRFAAAVTVPSHFVESRLIDDVGADPERVAVVPWSVSAAPEISGTVRDAVRARYRLPDRFVLYPAIAYAHKNHAVLLDAMAALSRDGGPRVDLVLTGGPGPLDAEVAEMASSVDLAGRVHVLGRVPAADLAAILAQADVVAVPSRYEGFGLPALEAMAAARPVVVARAGSLPEVTNGAALVVDPDDVAGWAAAIRLAADDHDERTRLVAAGLAVAASCTPQRTATALIDVWLRCLEGGRPAPRTARKLL